MNTERKVRPITQPCTIADFQTCVDFTSSFWRNSILFSALVVAFYKFAPTPSQDVYLTRWLAKLSTPLDVWENINAKHLHLAQQLSADTLLTSDARMSTVHRYRYPQLSVIFMLDDMVLSHNADRLTKFHLISHQLAGWLTCKGFL